MLLQEIPLPVIRASEISQRSFSPRESPTDEPQRLCIILPGRSHLRLDVVVGVVRLWEGNLTLEEGTQAALRAKKRGNLSCDKWAFSQLRIPFGQYLVDMRSTGTKWHP